MTLNQLRRKLVVCGGNGFLGSQICRSAVNRGWAVTSLSRSGAPPPGTTSTTDRWHDDVVWARADVFDPSTYSSHLDDADAVVHSMGILLEADYKGILNGTGGPAGVLSSLARLVSPTVSNTMAGTNPAEAQKKDSERGTTATTTPPPTYQRMNTQSALTLAQAVIDARKSDSTAPIPFLYISAAGSFFMLPSGYISSKRETEAHLQTGPFADHLRPFFLRPGFMTPARSGPATARSLLSVPITAGSRVTSIIDDAVGRGKLSAILGEGTTTKPLPVDEVGAAAVELLTAAVDGKAGEIQDGPVVTVDDISRLAALSWRKDLA